MIACTVRKVDTHPCCIKECKLQLCFVVFLHVGLVPRRRGDGLDNLLGWSNEDWGGFPVVIGQRSHALGNEDRIEITGKLRQ